MEFNGVNSVAKAAPASTVGDMGVLLDLSGPGLGAQWFYPILADCSYRSRMIKMRILSAIKPACALLLAGLFLAGCHGHLHHGHVPPGQVKKTITHGG